MVKGYGYGTLTVRTLEKLESYQSDQRCGYMSGGRDASLIETVMTDRHGIST